MANSHIFVDFDSSICDIKAMIYWKDIQHLRPGLGGDDEEEDVVTLLSTSNQNPVIPVWRTSPQAPPKTSASNLDAQPGVFSALFQTLFSPVTGTATGLKTAAETAVPQVTNFYRDQPQRGGPQVSHSSADTARGYPVSVPVVDSSGRPVYENQTLVMPSGARVVKKVQARRIEYRPYPGQFENETNYQYDLRQKNAQERHNLAYSKRDTETNEQYESRLKIVDKVVQQPGGFRETRSTPFIPTLPGLPTVVQPSFPGRTITRQQEALANAEKAKLIKAQAEASRKAYEESLQRQAAEKAAAYAAQLKAEALAKQKAQEAARQRQEKDRAALAAAQAKLEAARYAAYTQEMNKPLPETTLPDLPVNPFVRSSVTTPARQSFASAFTPSQPTSTYFVPAPTYTPPIFVPPPSVPATVLNRVTRGGTTLHGFEEAKPIATLVALGLLLYLTID